MKQKFEPLKAPSHLSAEARRWWEYVTKEWSLDEGAALVLRAALEAWDRMNEARESLREGGLTCTDRFKQLKPRPELAIERDARIAFLRAWSALHLDVDPPGPVGRPPR